MGTLLIILEIALTSWMAALILYLLNREGSRNFWIYFLICLVGSSVANLILTTISPSTSGPWYFAVGAFGFGLIWLALDLYK